MAKLFINYVKCVCFYEQGNPKTDTWLDNLYRQY